MGGYLSVSVCGEWGWGVNVREEGGRWRRKTTDMQRGNKTKGEEEEKK